ncbi:cyclic nucleotide-binding domain protein (macronuclear) [Tetrahymena thermophila SB210]|uniref:Cyclic nucleotide-binding domain protein n=1 Tax=Tetrahymena thermophila (strain SB210) TaxID=312017 RepID=Q23VX3_TETTS|nr:cyclic nucleotide-binding domain protein [Tetrahymena thermophila SB210]EAS00732.2 cyclic nucleotide-binding domain protein [Tetrahymena thermophila SB210]|eukprot:XP_001020977.2 cyclic nucleotide-binding domain protein [Tetrahymena thermophila SB210]
MKNEQLRKIKENLNLPSDKEYQSLLENARFFFIRSCNQENITFALQQSIWATTQKNEKALFDAFKKTQNVILVFGVNKTNYFQGVARMQQHILDKNSYKTPWKNTEAIKLGEDFLIRWLRVEDLPHQNCSDLKNALCNNEQLISKPKDCQEIDSENGKKLCLRFSLNTDEVGYLGSGGQAAQLNDWSQNQMLNKVNLNNPQFNNTNQYNSYMINQAGINQSIHPGLIINQSQNIQQPSPQQGIPSQNNLNISNPQHQIPRFNTANQLEDAKLNSTNNLSSIYDINNPNMNQTGLGKSSSNSDSDTTVLLSENIKQYNQSIEMSEDDFFNILEDLQPYKKQINASQIQSSASQDGQSVRENSEGNLDRIKSQIEVMEVEQEYQNQQDENQENYQTNEANSQAVLENENESMDGSKEYLNQSKSQLDQLEYNNHNSNDQQSRESLSNNRYQKRKEDDLSDDENENNQYQNDEDSSNQNNSNNNNNQEQKEQINSNNSSEQNIQNNNNQSSDNIKSREDKQVSSEDLKKKLPPTPSVALAASKIPRPGTKTAPLMMGFMNPLNMNMGMMRPFMGMMGYQGMNPMGAMPMMNPNFSKPNQFMGMNQDVKLNLLNPNPMIPGLNSMNKMFNNKMANNNENNFNPNMNNQDNNDVDQQNQNEDNQQNYDDNEDDHQYNEQDVNSQHNSNYEDQDNNYDQDSLNNDDDYRNNEESSNNRYKNKYNTSQNNSKGKNYQNNNYNSSNTNYNNRSNQNMNSNNSIRSNNNMSYNNNRKRNNNGDNNYDQNGNQNQSNSNINRNNPKNSSSNYKNNNSSSSNNGNRGNYNKANNNQSNRYNNNNNHYQDSDYSDNQQQNNNERNNYNDNDNSNRRDKNSDRSRNRSKDEKKPRDQNNSSNNNQNYRRDRDRDRSLSSNSNPVRKEDDFLVLISGEIVGVSRQIKFSPGSIFGGTSLARMIIKEKTFKCLEDCVFGIVELEKQKEYQLQLSELALINKTTYILQQSKYFSQWNSNQIEQIIQNSTRVFFKQNQWVYQEGQQSTSIYIVVSGKFSIYKRIFVRNQSQPELSSNQSQRQQLNPLKKCLDLSQGDVVGDEDEINQERFYGVCCKSENGYMLSISIQNFIEISGLQQSTYQQVQKRRKLTQKRYQYFEKTQQNELFKYQGTLTQISCQKQQSGQATPQEVSTFNSLNNSQTEHTTIIPSNRSNQKLKNAYQILQSRSNSQENLLIQTIQKSKENSNEDDPNLNVTHEDLWCENTNKFLSKQNSIESNSPIRRIQKSSSQSNISNEQLKCIPISFRIDYIQARKKLTRKFGDVKKNSKIVLPDESIKIAKSNLRAEQKEQSFEKFSEQAYKNISKEIKENYSIKFWHQMQNQIIKLATYSKKMNNDQNNQYIKQDPSSESRPLIRNIQKKIQNMNLKNNTIYNLENSGYIKRFNSTQDLTSPQKTSTSNYNSQPSYQNFIQQKSFAQINNEQSIFLEQGKLDKNLQTKSIDSSPLKKAPYSFHIYQQKQNNNQPHRYLIPAQAEPQCFIEAITAQKNTNLQNSNTIELKEGSLSPIISPIQKPIKNQQAFRSSLEDINYVKDKSPAYMSPIFNQLKNQSNTFKDHTFPRKSLINLYQMPKKQDEQREKDISKEILEQNNLINGHQSSEDQKNLVQNPSFNILQKRKAVQQSVQHDLTVSKSTHITPTGSPQKFQTLVNQKQQNQTLQASEKSSNRLIFSPTKRTQKNNHSKQLQICDYSTISKIYSKDKEDKASQILQNKLMNSNAQTFEKLKSLNAIIKKKEF